VSSAELRRRLQRRRPRRLRRTVPCTYRAVNPNGLFQGLQIYPKRASVYVTQAPICRGAV
jgi:hypothetical protein